LKTVLITGADGLIGSHLRQEWDGKYNLRLLSHKPIEGEQAIVADIDDLQALVSAFEGVDSVVHLAASAAVDSPWEAVLKNNIIGTYNVFEAARQAAVKQVIFASSNHAVGTYKKDFAERVRRGEQVMIDHLVQVRPDSLYGVSKCFGEALGRYYADHHGLRVICLRIGAINKRDAPKDDPLEGGMWMSQRDFAQLVENCLDADAVKFDIFYGVSNVPNRYFDLEHAREVVGFVPQDRGGNGS
jgi:nucleoside-diphosphate-sugar epimerase